MRTEAAIISFLALNVGACGGHVQIGEQEDGGANPGLLPSGGVAQENGSTQGTGGPFDLVGGNGGADGTTGGQGGVPWNTAGRNGVPAATGGQDAVQHDTAGRSGIQGTAGGNAQAGAPPTLPQAPGCPPSCRPDWMSNQVNVLVLGDATFTGADTRGRLWVKGNLTATASYDVGAGLTQDCSRRDLVVYGNVDVDGWVVLKNGSAAYGGTWSATGIMGPCGAFASPNDLPDLAAIEAEVRTYSSALASYPDNPGNVLDISAMPRKFEGTTPYYDPNTNSPVYVFNTSCCDFGSTSSINLTVAPAGSTVIINSTCDSIIFSGGEVTMEGMPKCSDQGGTDGACNRILYNFPDARSVHVTGTTVQGSVLAPDAKLTGYGAAFAGTLVVGSIETAIEFHSYFFEGCLRLPDQTDSGQGGAEAS